MLPYPSGDIHVGHVRNYCITDVIARYKTMRGMNVLHPIGWDALGLPAENAAIKRGVHPEKWTRDNIAGMKRQLQRLGFSYPWSREIATCDPEYYRWNQWFFLRMLEQGIAYRKKAAVNWCPSCQTVLANEQAEGGECWRCHSKVEERELDQWFLRITAYQDAARSTTWSSSRRGRTACSSSRRTGWDARRGPRWTFRSRDESPSAIFTTRIDTIYGATFMVLAPEHPRGGRASAGKDAGEAKPTIAGLRAQDRRARLEGQVEKEGVFTGRYATNPFSGERIPIWVGNFVLMGYGTGAIMSVPAHDERDFEFARKYGIPVRVVIQPEGGTLAGRDARGRVRRAGTGREQRSVRRARPRTTPSRRWRRTPRPRASARPRSRYRLKDWLISRQRYWGTPIPVVYCDEGRDAAGSGRPASRSCFPQDAPFTGEGGNPLEKVPAFVEAVCPKCGGKARRETDTMDTFVDSSWYFYRYLSPRRTTAPSSPEAVKYWFPIDLYVGGIEHAILHLVYSRFWTKVMRDLGLVALRRAGDPALPAGHGPQGRRDHVEVEGQHRGPRRRHPRVRGGHAAALRPVRGASRNSPWSGATSGIEGPHRFLHRVWRAGRSPRRPALRGQRKASRGRKGSGDARVLRRKMHQTIARVTEDIDERIHLNTAVAALMELVNEIYRPSRRWRTRPGAGGAPRSHRDRSCSS